MGAVQRTSCPSPRVVADLTADRSGEIQAIDFTADGLAVVLFLEPGAAEAVTGRDDRGMFADTRAASPYEAVVVVHDGKEVVEEHALREIEVAWPQVTRLPSGELLVAGARCARFQDGTVEQNAQLFAGAGAPSAAFTLGDGINDIAVDGSGGIWVGYSDEGVFGNYGWTEPIGSPGLVRFDRAGAVTWRFGDGLAPGTAVEPITDLYALNVGADEVWASYYSEFPIVRIAGGETTVWTNDVEPVGTVAPVGPGEVLIGEPEGLTVVGLGADGTTTPRRAYEPPAQAGMWARGSTLHFFDGTTWSQLNAADLR